MGKLSKDLYLAVGALSIGCVLKSVEYFLECVNFAGIFLLNFPNVTICA